MLFIIALWYNEGTYCFGEQTSSYWLLFIFLDPLVQIAIDNSRNILYARSEKGSILAYYLGQDGKSLSKVAAIPLQNTVHNASHIAR